jgi:hypothetical protein
MKAKLFLLAALLAATTVNADTAKQVAETAKQVANGYLNDIVRDFKECKDYKVNKSYGQYYRANPSLETDLTNFCTELLKTYTGCQATDKPWDNKKASKISLFYESNLRETLEKLFVEKGSAIDPPCLLKRD